MLANGMSCSDEILYDLLEWSPFTVVLDGALDRVIQKGIRPDVVLGDFDSIESRESLENLDRAIKTLQIDDQNTTDFEKGLDYLISNGHRAVHVLWATGLRLDHTWNNLLSMAKYAEKIQITLVDDFGICHILSRKFRKTYPEGFKLSIMPVTDTYGVSTKGLKYNLNNEDLIVPLRTSSSNEVLGDGFVEIDHERGILALIENR